MLATYLRLRTTVSNLFDFSNDLGGRSPFRHFLVFVLLLAPHCSIARAQTSPANWTRIHLEDDRLWARKSGIDQAAVRHLRELAGLSNDMALTRISKLDATTLSFRKQILLVIAGGNGHCLTLHVFSSPPYREVWSADALPDGSGFCRKSPGNPKAYATKDGTIVVDIPVSDGLGVAGHDCYLFAWNGSSYQLR